MDKQELMTKVAEMIQTSKTAVLATVDGNDRPRVRWMSPVLLPEHGHNIYAVTSRRINKYIELDSKPGVEWVFQTAALDVVINITGKINILDNPSLKAQVLEAVASHLSVYYRLDPDPAENIILETVPESGTFFRTMQGAKETVNFT